MPFPPFFDPNKEEQESSLSEQSIYNSIRRNELNAFDANVHMGERRGFFDDIIVDGNEISREEQNVDIIIPDGLLQSTQDSRTFLKSYYRFLYSQHLIDPDKPSGSYLINSRIYKARDIDEISSPEALSSLFFEIAKDFQRRLTNGDPFHVDPKSLLKNAVDFFSHGGNEDSFKNLLKLILADFSTQVSEPWDDVFHVSHSVWVQQKFIAIDVSTSNLETGADKTDLKYFSTAYFHKDIHGNLIDEPHSGFEISRIEWTDSGNTVRLYTIDPLLEELLEEGLGIRVVDADGVIRFEGTLIPDLVGIDVIDGGKYWQKGQIILFPGTDKRSILRVEETYSKRNPGGFEPYSIKRIEVIDFGFKNDLGETIVVSPFEYDPTFADSSITAKRQTTFPFAIDYTINIDDNSIGTHDAVVGLGPGDYFLQNYDETPGEEPYSYSLLFGVVTHPYIKKEQDATLTNISPEKWLESLARLRVRFGLLGKLPGNWETNDSIASDELTRLQDNFFYQRFSYLISSLNRPELYKDPAMMFHPAGLKRFFEYRINEYLNVNATIDDLFYHILDLLSIVVPIHPEPIKEVIKPLKDCVGFGCWDGEGYDECSYDTCESLEVILIKNLKDSLPMPKTTIRTGLDAVCVGYDEGSWDLSGDYDHKICHYTVSLETY